MAISVSPIDILESSNNPLLLGNPSWKRKKVCEFASIQNGFAFKSDLFTKDKGKPVIRIRDVGKSNTETYYSGSYGEEYVVKPGDLLVGMDGDFKCAFWNGPDALLNQRVCRIIPENGNINSKWLLYQLQPFLDEIHKNTSSVTVKHLSSKTINDIPILFPRKEVQDAIIAKIDELFSELDHAEEQLRKAKEQLEAYRQSVLKYAFEGYYTNGFNDCKRVKLKEVSNINPKTDVSKLKDETLVHFIPMRSVQEESGEINLSEFRDYKDVKKGFTTFTCGDIIMAKITPCMENGKIAIIPTMEPNVAFGSTEFHIIRVNNSILNTYVFYYLLQQVIRKEAEFNMTGAVGQKRVPKAFLEDLHIPLPTIEIQKQVIDIIKAKIDAVSITSIEVERQLISIKTLRQSILLNAFTGQLI